MVLLVKIQKPVRVANGKLACGVANVSFPANTNLHSIVSYVAMPLCNKLFNPTREFLCCDGDIQLFGGSVLNEGRVELCLSGQWKTVCDNNWGDSEAQVVCKQLGYSHKGTYLKLVVTMS